MVARFVSTSDRECAAGERRTRVAEARFSSMRTNDSAPSARGVVGARSVSTNDSAASARRVSILVNAVGICMGA